MSAYSVPAAVFGAGDSVVSQEGKVLVFLWLRAWEETDKHILMIMKCDKDELGVEGRL